MLAGLFRDGDTAERAYQALRSRGYSEADVSLMMSDETRQRLVSGGAAPASGLGHKALEGAGVGAGVGVVAGGVLGALVAAATVVVPGVGLVIVGPVAAALAGAGVGGAAGGMLGALVGAGIPEDQAKTYESGLRAGGIVIGVAPRTDEDRDHFERHWRT
jgi:hypothetical protein